MPTVTCNESQLIAQIGLYSSTASISRAVSLSDAGRAKLYEGIREYRARQTNADPMFHRKRFIEHVNQVNQQHAGFSGKTEDRKTNPDGATIKLDNLLNITVNGESINGAELYKNALQEERYSVEYMNAVLDSSWEHHEGKGLAERPIVIIAGPSASGKSFAADAMVQETARLLPTVPQSRSGYDVVAVDNGKARETSQMRKLAIQLAVGKGYSGIQDLHDQSKVLREVKDIIQEAALETPNLGLVIPETFSDQWVPKRTPEKFFQPLTEIQNSRIVFCRVGPSTLDGAEELFQKSVQFMGSSRAWKSTGFEAPLQFDLNQKNLPESKAYDGRGFMFGCMGSKRVEEWFLGNDPKKYAMYMVHDLVLLEPNPKSAGEWQPASKNGPDTILISNAVYQHWLEKRKAGTESRDLKTFKESTPSTPQIAMSAAAARDRRQEQVIFGHYDEDSEKRFIKMRSELSMTAQIHTNMTHYIDQLKQRAEHAWNDTGLTNLSAAASRMHELHENIIESYNIMLLHTGNNDKEQNEFTLDGELVLVKLVESAREKTVQFSEQAAILTQQIERDFDSTVSMEQLEALTNAYNESLNSISQEMNQLLESEHLRSKKEYIAAPSDAFQDILAELESQTMPHQLPSEPSSQPSTISVMKAFKQNLENIKQSGNEVQTPEKIDSDTDSLHP